MADETKLSICNQALGGFGSKLLSDYDTDTTNHAVKCRLFYDPTRKALLRSFPWIFAGARQVLSTAGDPPFQWNNMFQLPKDYLALRYDNTVTNSLSKNGRWQIEGDKVYTNNDEVELVYTKDEEDPAVFDPLFVKMFVVTLKVELIFPIAGTSATTLALHERFEEDLAKVTSKARRITRKENNTGGRSDFNLARYGRGRVYTEGGRVYGG